MHAEIRCFGAVRFVMTVLRRKISLSDFLLLTQGDQDNLNSVHASLLM